MRASPWRRPLVAALLAACHRSAGAAGSCRAGCAAPQRADPRVGAEFEGPQAQAVELLQRSKAARRHGRVPNEPQEAWRDVEAARQRSSVSRERAAASPELQAVLPIAWMHVPKTGTSFINTLMLAPGVCPTLDLEPLVCPDCGRLAIQLETEIFPANCPGLSSYSLRHAGIDEPSLMPGYAAGKGHFMTMLRQPEQRLISAYQDMKQCNDYPVICNISAGGGADGGLVLSNNTSWGGWFSSAMPSLEEMARQQSGCAVRMLTQSGFPCMGLGAGAPAEADVAEARRRLREGFAFVGITDYWDLSLCLFDAMFKVGCHDYQFNDARPGEFRKTTNESALHPLEPLNGVTDPYDGALYAEGLDIMRENLRKFNVTLDSCEPCWRQAGLSLEEARGQGFPQ